MKNRGLGRGLSSLLGEEMVVQTAGDNSIILMDLRFLEAGKYQPRKNFDQEALNDLAASIREHGVMQPIVVHPLGDGRYAIIAGERRFRAAGIAGLEVIPAIVKDVAKEKVLELALVENIQREDLNVMEEAEGYEQLMNDFGYTQEEIAKLIGKSRSHIANLLRLNSLPEVIKEHLNNKTLTMGHARLLVGNEMSEDLASIMIERSLSVRQAEDLVKNWSDRDKIQKSRKAQGYSDANNDYDTITKPLVAKFGMRVSIESNNDGGGGRLIFHYSSLQQLDEMLTKLN